MGGGSKVETVGSELELGLGLSLGGGAWGERGRILTARDFPILGTKRAADDSSSLGGASPPRSSQVVGWPPIGSHRMNSLVNSNQATRGALRAASDDEGDDKKRNAANEKDKPKELGDGSTKRKLQVAGLVKVNMDGVAIGRKVDVNGHSSYENLAMTLEDMFMIQPISAVRLTGSCSREMEKAKHSKLLDGSSEFVLTYEDKEGDWMLVGDVPWRMFLSSVRRLRIMRTSEANGLDPRHEEQKGRERQRNKPV